MGLVDEGWGVLSMGSSYRWTKEHLDRNRAGPRVGIKNVSLTHLAVTVAILRVLCWLSDSEVFKAEFPEQAAFLPYLSLWAAMVGSHGGQPW